MSADHLRQMKRRLGMAPPSSSLGLEPAAEKMDMLEKTLNAFRTEVDMKLKIIQQILTTRNEQVTVQKKLLDREQSLYNTLLAHWLNTADLAASGVSMNFSADLTESLDTEDLDFDFSDDNFDLTASPGDGTSSGAPATKKPRRRHRKISKVTKTEPRADGTTEVTEELDGASDPLDQRYEHNYDDDGDRDEEWVPSGNMETIEGEHGNEHNEDWQNDPSPPIKRQRQSHNWTRVKRFATGKEALDFIREEKLWRACGKNEGLQGRKISYNCKFSKLCGAKAYILFKRDSEDAEVYKTTSEHTHSDPKRRGLTESTKEKVIQLISDGLSKPKIILSTLRECGLEEPPAKVLINFLSSIRNKQSK